MGYKYVFLLFQLTASVAYGGQDGGACVNASQLWKWVDGRQPKTTARASCGGKYFEADAPQALNVSFASDSTDDDGLSSDAVCGLDKIRSGTPVNQVLRAYPVSVANEILDHLGDEQVLHDGLLVPPTIVSVDSESSEYIDESNPASTDIASDETYEKLRMSCAQAVLDSKKTTDPVWYSQHSVFDIENSIVLHAPELKPGEVADSRGEFAYAGNAFTDAQKQAIVKRLNMLNSCSTFSEVKDGVIMLPNCTMQEEALVAKRVKDYKKTMYERIAAAVLISAAGNYFRGGEIFRTGNDQITRAVNALLLASMNPLVEDKPESWLTFARDWLLDYAAQMTYVTHGFVGGGQKFRHIGSYDYTQTLLQGALENSQYFSEVTNSPWGGLGGLPVGGVYSLIGMQADNNYMLDGKSANAWSEAATGGLLGFTIGVIDAIRRLRELNKMPSEGGLSIAQAQVSSLDLCVDISDILNPPNSSPAKLAKTQ